MGRYQLTPVWAVAARGEYVHDKNDYFATGRSKFSMATGTLTLEAKPSNNLIIRLDARDDIVLDGARPTRTSSRRRRATSSSSQITTTLGVVVTTN